MRGQLGTAAQSWHTARGLYDSVTQANGTVKMQSQGETIFNKESEQVQQQEPKGKRAPPASSSSSAQEPHLTNSNQLRDRLLCSFPTRETSHRKAGLLQFSHPFALPRHGVKEANVTWPGGQTLSNTPKKINRAEQ